MSFETTTVSKQNRKTKTKRYRNVKNKKTDRQKPSFTKEWVENTNLFKPVHKAIMNTRE